MKKFLRKIVVVIFVMAIAVAGIPHDCNSRESVNAATFPQYIVVLDAGHDATHAGAGNGGYREESLTYRIAAYCKAELEKYGSVKVYMVRDGYGCPNGGSSVNSKTCNAKRVEFSKNHNADIYVSFHLNSAGASARGASVYYPNSSYRPEIGEKGRILATDILNQLKSVGVSQNGRGTLIRNSEDNTRYPDGSLADYLAVIKGNKLNNIPAVLIEHCFISNANDCASFLSSEAKLKMLGTADANGIAEYLGIRGSAVNRASDGNWYYYKNGVIDYSYTGLASNSNGWWYIKNGKVDFTANTVVPYRGVWCYVKGGKYDPSFTGMAQNQNGYWYIRDGLVDFNYTGLAACYSTQNYNGKNYNYAGWYYFNKGYFSGKDETVAYTNGSWWYVHNGMIDFKANTVAHNSNGWWYVKDGKVDFGYNGVARNINGDWYIKNGKVDFGYTGLRKINNQSQIVNSTTGEKITFDGWYYFENGKVNTTSTTVAYDGTNWLYVHNGEIDETVNTVAHNSNGWWYVKDGKVDFGFNGIARNQNGDWYIKGGKVQFGTNDVVHSSEKTQMYPDNSNGEEITFDGWYYVKNGQVQYNQETVQHNSNGWWYIGTDGKVDFNFNGIASNGNGSWWLDNGKVTFKKTGLITYNDTTYYVKESKVQNQLTDVVNISGKWYYLKNGILQTGAETVAHNSNGWWYIGTDGSVDFDYNGVASNDNGTWYLENGRVTFSYNGSVDINDKTYNVISSKVQL